tara:strand:- start:2264 stop:2614 length:351 start_codon:yes stop_codon:yes gene_type:complete
MACGESAEAIYTLLDELGGPEVASSFVLQDLIKYMKGDDIRDFVDYFRRNHDMKESIIQTHFAVNVDDETEDFEENNYVLCMDCQDTVHSDEYEDHRCKIDSAQSPRFFSSRIPEC